MEVTFVANARIMGYKPGQIIRTEMTKQLHALLAVGRHLTLIDPPTLAEVYAPVAVPEIPASMAFEPVAVADPPVKDEDGGSSKGASNPEERGSFDFPNYRQPTTKSSGKRKDGATGNHSIGN